MQKCHERLKCKNKINKFEKHRGSDLQSSFLFSFNGSKHKKKGSRLYFVILISCLALLFYQIENLLNICHIISHIDSLNENKMSKIEMCQTP